MSVSVSPLQLPLFPLSKVCTKCGVEKGLDLFPQSKTKALGRSNWCRACHADYHRARREHWRELYAQNKERHHAWWRDYFAVNRDKINERRRRWRANHPEYRAKEREANYRWRWSDPERTRAYARRKYAANKEIHKIRCQRWIRANPERRKVLIERYRARAANAEGFYTPEDIKALYASQDAACAYCGVSLIDGYTIEHMMPLVRGGSNWPDNICLACARCNSRKGSKTAVEFRAQLMREASA